MVFDIFMADPAAHGEVHLVEAVGHHFAIVGDPVATRVEVAEVARFRTFKEPVGEGELGGNHSGINLGCAQNPGVAKRVGNQGQYGEDAHEEDAASDHDFDERKGGWGTMNDEIGDW